MKKIKAIPVLTSLLLICTISLSLWGCSTEIRAADLMDGIEARDIPLKDSIGDNNADVTDFALRLLKSTANSGENTLISPLSIICALAMTANGADGETLSQMETVFGMSAAELNTYLHTYLSRLPEGKKYKLSVANSIWFTDDVRFTVNKDFLQTNADYYGADIYKSEFSTRQTLIDMNNWVKQETDGMIPKAVDEIPPDAIMYLVNALAFESEWSDVYEHRQVQNGKFNKEDGTVQRVDMMYSSEGRYIEDENAVGFIKYYVAHKYAFVALLPHDGITVSEYIEGLDGETLNALISEAEFATVNAAIPKFETEYDTDLSGVLSTMGMTDAFDPREADFGRLGGSDAGNISISRVIHKTHIQVGEKGTKAGAVTVVETKDRGTGPVEDPKEVHLDRPFIYMIIDCENNIPLFMGIMNDVKA